MGFYLQSEAQLPKKIRIELVVGVLDEHSKVLLMVSQLLLQNLDLLSFLAPLAALPFDERPHALAYRPKDTR